MTYEILQQSEPLEIWRPVTDYVGIYSVSNMGRVRSEKRVVTNGVSGSRRVVRERILILRPDGHGYMQASLHKNGCRVLAKVASLVAAAFVGRRTAGLDVCHNDGNRKNNRAGNLRYDTRIGNMADCVKHGTRLMGDRHGASKLTAEKVLAIRGDNRTIVQIAPDYGISFQHVSAIKRRHVWTHV